MNRLRHRTRTLGLTALTLGALAAAGPRAAEVTAQLGVYEYVVEKAPGTVGEVAQAVETAVGAGGWQVLARIDANAPRGCGYRAQVLAVVEPGYARKLMTANRRTAPFVVVDRINVFEDEAGVHVAVLNAESVARTVLMDDRAQVEVVKTHLADLRGLVGGAVRGKASDREYGQRRSAGYIGKTMGVMAGGPFTEKVKDEKVVGGHDWKAVAEKVRTGLSRRGAKWGLQLAYTLELADQETVVFGTTGTPMDSQSFSIVGAGADETRTSYKCPGLAHAAAYPLEVVVTREGEQVKVRIVDTMYRMKLYFEDAGNWAFMKNMGMPGSIRDELASQIASGLGAR